MSKRKTSRQTVWLSRDRDSGTYDIHLCEVRPMRDSTGTYLGDRHFCEEMFREAVGRHLLRKGSCKRVRISVKVLP